MLRALREAFVLVASGATVLVSAADLLGGAAGAGELVAAAVLSTAVVVLLVLRRRWPLAVSVATTGLYAVDGDVVIAALVALGALAVRSSWRRACLGAVVALGVLVLRQTGYGSDVQDLWLEPGGVAIGVLGIALVTCAGLYVKARRDLLAAAVERARRVEAEQELREERARHRERTRIAREMHDVLAHRLSMLSLHAGALEYREDIAGSQVAEAAAVIRENAHEALQDLRDVLGVLRARTSVGTSGAGSPDDGDEDADGSGGTPAGLRPPPTIAHLPALVREATALGSDVSLNVTGPVQAPSGAAGRAAYRIVQEGLTNARKHAPGAHTDVDVDVDAAQIHLRVVNSAPREGPSAAHDLRARGSGNGLTGVAERVELLGGSASHGPTADGGFRLDVVLPHRPPGRRSRR
ncbi:sensor histidine kinase [Kineococcus sp. TBRC 1896]|uniref:histidine kinase n=1 Tax=Kineococcus mangrovi TaxID=1660183 RepID=A0ABV4I2F9_9ACTN